MRGSSIRWALVCCAVAASAGCSGASQKLAGSNWWWGKKGGESADRAIAATGDSTAPKRPSESATPTTLTGGPTGGGALAGGARTYPGEATAFNAAASYPNTGSSAYNASPAANYEPVGPANPSANTWDGGTGERYATQPAGGYPTTPAGGGGIAPQQGYYDTDYGRYANQPGGAAAGGANGNDRPAATTGGAGGYAAGGNDAWSTGGGANAGFGAETVGDRYSGVLTAGESQYDTASRYDSTNSRWDGTATGAARGTGAAGGADATAGGATESNHSEPAYPDSSRYPANGAAGNASWPPAQSGEVGTSRYPTTQTPLGNSEWVPGQTGYTNPGQTDYNPPGVPKYESPPAYQLPGYVDPSSGSGGPGGYRPGSTGTSYPSSGQRAWPGTTSGASRENRRADPVSYDSLEPPHVELPATADLSRKV